MSELFNVPLQVMFLGIVISYGIAVLMKVMLAAIRVFTKTKQ
jgi:hypothetical protein